MEPNEEEEVEPSCMHNNGIHLASITVTQFIDSDGDEAVCVHVSGEPNSTTLLGMASVVRLSIDERVLDMWDAGDAERDSDD